MSPQSAEYQTQALAASEAVRQKDVQSKSVKQVVEDKYADVPILINVARCESQFRQTTTDGKILHGEANKYDVGVMQVNELYHATKAKSLGYDIYTLQGNLDYARYLYDREGTRPWMASAGCWANSSEDGIVGKSDISNIRT